MKILALILIILGLSKLLFTINLEASDLYPLSYAYRLDPDRVYKQLCCFLIGDGIVSTIGGLFLMFLI